MLQPHDKTIPTSFPHVEILWYPRYRFDLEPWTVFDERRGWLEKNARLSFAESQHTTKKHGATKF